MEDCQVFLHTRDELPRDAVPHWSTASPTIKWPGVTVDSHPPPVHALTTVPNVRLTGIILSRSSEMTELRALNPKSTEGMTLEQRNGR